MRESGKTTIFLITAMLAWGSVYPVSKYLMADISPGVLGFLRYFTAIIALSPFFVIEIRKNNIKFDAKSVFLFFSAGLTGTTLLAIFLFSGVARSTASNGSIIINSQPIFTAILAPLLIRESVSGIQTAGILAGFAGMFLVVTGGNFNFSSGGSNYLFGNLLLLAGAVSMSLYGIIIKAPVKKYGSIIATWISMTAGTIILFLYNLFTVDHFLNQVFIPAGTDVLLIVYLGSIGTAAAYLLFSLALHKIDVLKATAFKFLIPVSGISLSMIFLGERPAIAVYAGIFIVIFSVFLIQRNSFQFSNVRKAKS